ncbi:hypothetical protein WICPIJ_008297 [Wickerhamomyces pijperi]|uniref:N-(5'-phosphoribosyl)anthranilate isomerase n=1 Tax=Wickerhamomyces pijperi TaxID=599730 RepID=A0A9P8PXY7_WICPI|nr:hypothetical protein WICPIJ_008297 [Wickerhamomyces pijperi]
MSLVKICGLRDPLSAETALTNGADLLGMILVPNRSRTIDSLEANKIYDLVQQSRRGKKTIEEIYESSRYGNDNEKVIREIKENGPFLVGVFQNQTIEQINDICKVVNFDIVQLHGQEPRKEFIDALEKPVITRYTLSDSDINQLVTEETQDNKKQILTLFDSAVGGEGSVIDWTQIAKLPLIKTEVILAGGLTPENVKEAMKLNNVCGVDVSSGVETSKVKDQSKIKAFIENARAV